MTHNLIFFPNEIYNYLNNVEGKRRLKREK
jgi:hypothetical protein